MNSSLPRWSKGGVPISEANGDSLEVTVDHSYFTDPVSCEVSNSVGSTNVSTLVDVQCKSSSAPQSRSGSVMHANACKGRSVHELVCILGERGLNTLHFICISINFKFKLIVFVFFCI